MKYLDALKTQITPINQDPQVTQVSFLSFFILPRLIFHLPIYGIGGLILKLKLDWQ